MMPFFFNKEVKEDMNQWKWTDKHVQTSKQASIHN